MNILTRICSRKINARALPAPGLPAKIKQHLQAYRSNDDGAMAILTLMFLVAFLIMGGFGLAVMRHEMTRAKLSVTGDAAALACAGAPSGTTADERKAIAEDYFDKIGFANNLDAIDIDGEGEDDIVTSLNSTKCSISAQKTIDTYLIKLVGVDTLTAASAGTAEIATPKLEVSLVLDVSGSMGGSKIANLKVAAKEFVTTILGSGEPGEISISLIPFSWGVTPPDTIFNALTIDQTHNYSNCIVFLQDDFDDTTIDPGATYRQQIFTSRYGDDNFGDMSQTWRSCFTDDYFEMLPYSMSESDLHNQIDSFQARGYTSGQLGIKWGAAMLDPAFQPIATALKATGEMNAALVNVPSDWDEPESLKIIVMMGDGANTTSRYFNDPNDLNDPSLPENHTQFDYRGPGSDLHQVDRLAGLDPLFYINDPAATDPTDPAYYDIENNAWLTEAEFVDLSNTLANFDESRQLNWETAWGLMTPEYYSDIIGDDDAFNDYSYEENVSGGMKNPRMASACSAAKDEGIIIYTIGFEVTANGTAETHLRNCAQSVSHYFPVEGVNIGQAFSAIAANVQNLRLTQ